MQAVVLRRGFINVIADPAVDKGMADRVGNIMVNKTGKVGDSFFFLLSRADQADMAQAAVEKLADLMFMHVRTDIPVILMTENGNVVKENVVALEAELLKPAVFGYDML